jgi:hypothetical protein
MTDLVEGAVRTGLSDFGTFQVFIPVFLIFLSFSMTVQRHTREIQEREDKMPLCKTRDRIERK